MMILHKGSPVVKLALLTVLGVASLAWSVRAAKADGLDKYTGYTRPGALNEVPVPAEAAKPAGLDPVRTGLGATVYFRVYDLSEGAEGDPWNTGVKNFANAFVPGKDSTGSHPSRKLDTSARYLYLYQTINDSKRESNVKMTTIRLIVPPHLITSWGYFGTKGENVPLRGVGFSAPVIDPSPDHPEFKDHIRPASVDNPAANRKVPYDRHAEAHLSARPYGVMPIGIGNIRHVGLDDNGLGEDIGREPESVVLLNAATFDGPPRRRTNTDGVYGTSFLNGGLYGMDRLCGCGGFGGMGYGGLGYGGMGYGGIGYPFISRINPGPLALYSPAVPLYAPLAPIAAGVPVGGVGVEGGIYDNDLGRTEEEMNRSPAVRAYWLDSPLKPGERGTIFGFTSNYPPTYEDVRLRGNPRFAIGLIALAPDLANATLVGEGEVPTPVAHEQAVAGAFGSTVGFLGGMAQTGTTGGTGGGLGAGGGLPGFGGGLSNGTSGGGGTTGGGTPGAVGSDNGTNPTPGTTTINNNNQQKQQQQQQQQQKLKEKESENEDHTPSTVVPEPASFLAALLGLPVAFYVVRRKLTGKKAGEGDAKI